MLNNEKLLNFQDKLIFDISLLVKKSIQEFANSIDDGGLQKEKKYPPKPRTGVIAPENQEAQKQPEK